MTMDLKNKSTYDSAIGGITVKEIDNGSCITGDTDHLLPKLKESMANNIE